MPSCRCCVIGAVIGLAVAASSQPLAGQATHCDPCIQLSHEVRLSSHLGVFAPSMSQSVLRTPGGRYLVSHLFAGPAIAIYDSTGGWIGLFDRGGDGPGEFRSSPNLLSGPDGSVYGANQYRLVRFDAGLNVLSTARTDFQVYGETMATVLPSGAMAIYHRGLATDQGIKYDVSILGRDGSLMKPVQRSDGPVDVALVVAPSATGGFWTLSRVGLRLREYSGEGELQRSVLIDSDWLTPDEERSEGGPRHIDLRDLGDGRLLLVSSVSDSDSRPEESDQEGVINLTTLDRNSRFDSVVQLLNARSGEVLAWRRFDEALRLVEGVNDLFFSTHAGAFGHIETQIWKLMETR